MSSSNNMINIDNTVTPAALTWQEDEQGVLVPVSNIFGDVYYSLADGLAESRYVFIDKNRLPERFSQLFMRPKANGFSVSNTFTIAELGFGTGLNVLVTWQLWRDIKNQFALKTHKSDDSLMHKTPHLHIISTEKYPLTYADLSRSLESWKIRDSSLTPFITQLLKIYPTLVSGCHRLHLDTDVTLDLWLGDATVSLQNLSNSYSNSFNQAHIDAWYLDGFAPSRNESLWAAQIFEQIERLSKHGTTAATFSSAGVVKRGLIAAGFRIKKEKGFGRKRQMLTATKIEQDYEIPIEADETQHSNIRSIHKPPMAADRAADQATDKVTDKATDLATNIDTNKASNTDSINSPFCRYSKVAIIGAGVSGLMAAWSLAERGLQVILIDKIAPLAGASGNPRALLAPKMTPLAHVAEHLHSISYLYSQRRYQQLDRQAILKQNIAQQDVNPHKAAQQDLAKPATAHPQINESSTQDSLPPPYNPIFEHTGTLDLLLKANVNIDQIADYPLQMATTLSVPEAQAVSGLQHQDLQENVYLPQAGLVNPKALADTILAHPNITFKQASIEHIVVKDDPKPEIQLYSSYLSSTHSTGNNSSHSSGNNKSASDLKAYPDPIISADAVIIAAAFKSQNLDSRIFEFRKIRGQLSWFEPTSDQHQALPKLPLKYGGYCAAFIPSVGDEKLNPVTPKTTTFLLGASFVRNDTSTDIRAAEHGINRDKLITAIPELKDILSSGNTTGEFTHWKARVGIRAQTPDYHPLVGQVDDTGLIWTLSGMGSKGYAFAPLCAEVLADMMLGQFTPLPRSLLDKLSPQRKSLQKPLT